MSARSASPKIETDFLVVGSGVAGLRAAIELSRAGRVLMLTKGHPLESNSMYAQGGVAVALSELDDAEVPLIDTSEEGQTGRVKFNPLAAWTWGDVWHYIQQHQVAYNPLHDEFYPSIGCAPCTRAISLGEDFRAGRWWWEDEAAKECGLHVKHDNPTEQVAA